MNLIKTISTKLTNAVRFVKFLRMGDNDIQEVEQVAPYGVDSNPIKDMVALYAPTLQQGNAVVVGYINKNQIADVGETRIFSTDSDGELKTYIHLLNDGVMEIGGDADFMVRFGPTKANIEELQNDINNLKSIISAWVPVPNDGGAALKAALSSWYGSALVEQIDNAKIDEIKTL